MSSQNSFLTKYSKSNSHSQDSQKINESLEWLNEKIMVNYIVPF